MSNLLPTLLEIFLGVLGLSVVVLVHEGGHYFAARMVGVQVETFSIGFGPRLLGFRRGPTDYRISLVPLGGYCRFLGEDSFRLALENNLDSIPSKNGDFYSCSPLKRIWIALCGPLANAIFAIVVFAIISWVGFQENYTDSRIVLASEYSESDAQWPADKAGLQSGDRIIAVDGKTVDRFQELRRNLVLRPNDLIPLTVERNGNIFETFITPQLDKENGQAVIGVLNWIDPIIANVIPDSPAHNAGFQPGDVIIQIQGQSILHTVGISSAIENNSNTNTEIIIMRNNRQMTLIREMDATSFVGIEFAIRTGRSLERGPFESFVYGIGKTWNTLTSMIRGIRMMFMGIQIQNAVSGPMRLISDTGATVAAGFRSGLGPGLLWSFEIMAIISISLAFLNLLPIPVLDGGQITLFIVEMLRKKPQNPRSIYKYQFIGAIIVIVIAIISTTGDLLHFRSR